jgi:hypothetical protein
MTCLVDNSAVLEAETDPRLFLTAFTDERPSENKKVANDSSREVKQQTIVSVNLKPEQYIAFQMHDVPEQKGVFVYHDDGVYYITVLVEKRDLALNRKIFERERNVIHFYRQHRFDLSIIPLTDSRQFAPKGTQIL